MPSFKHKIRPLLNLNGNISEMYINAIDSCVINKPKRKIYPGHNVEKRIKDILISGGYNFSESKPPNIGSRETYFIRASLPAINFILQIREYSEK